MTNDAIYKSPRSGSPYRHASHCQRLLDLKISRRRLNAINLSRANYGSNQQDALHRIIYYSKSALQVSGDVLAHHQEHLTVFTVSSSTNIRQ